MQLGGYLHLEGLGMEKAMAGRRAAFRGGMVGEAGDPSSLASTRAVVDAQRLDA